MWLAGGNRPDFRMINRFRGEVMKGEVREVFTGVLELLIEEGYVKWRIILWMGRKWRRMPICIRWCGRRRRKIQGPLAGEDRGAVGRDRAGE
ncbi:MAG: hypothetical protein MUO30_02250 [Anaerolineales bacterium]|nr:hypothetical protein [Anaerolineales bacterium]